MHKALASFGLVGFTVVACSGGSGTLGDGGVVATSSGSPGATSSSSSSSGSGASGNVEFNTCSAPPTPCGGDPNGTWTLVGGCAQAAGTCAGTGTVTATGTTTVSGRQLSVNYHAELRACGEASNEGDSASVTLDADAGATSYRYCVDGVTLWIYLPVKGNGLDMKVLKLTRS